MQENVTRPVVVLVGAGFGGITAAQALARSAVCIVLIDRTNHHVFQPLLYQAATAALAPSDIASPIRGILRRQLNTTVIMGDVIGVDPARRVVAVRETGEFEKIDPSGCQLPASGSRAPMCSGALAPRRVPQQRGLASMPRAMER